MKHDPLHRKFKVEVGVAYGEPGDRWDTVTVHVTANPNDDEGLRSNARWAAAEKLGSEPYARLWCHRIEGPLDNGANNDP